MNKCIDKMRNIFAVSASALLAINILVGCGESEKESSAAAVNAPAAEKQPAKPVEPAENKSRAPKKKSNTKKNGKSKKTKRTKEKQMTEQIGGFGKAPAKNLQLKFTVDRKTLLKCPVEFEGEVIVPQGVMIIAEEAFKGCEKVTSVVLPDGLITIADGAFSDCIRLKKVVIPESVTSIEARAFSGCIRLTDIKIPAGVTKIYSWTFNNCKSLTNIAIPLGVRCIYGNTFRDCRNLVSVEIPASVAFIWGEAFYGCNKLSNVKVPENCDVGKISFPASCKVIQPPGYWYDKAGVEKLKKQGFQFDYSGRILRKCPDKIEGDVIVPYGVTTIHQRAFLGCRNLTGVTLPASVVAIEEHAFGLNEKLTRLVIPANVAFIEGSSLSTIKKVEIDAANKYFKNDEYGALLSKDGKTFIHLPREFSGHYKIPAGVTEIQGHAFYGCDNLTGVTIPEGVVTIRKYAFYGCDNLTEVAIPDGVTTIGANAFGYCKKLAKVKMPGTLVVIEEEAFWSCAELQSITIPESVEYIGSRAFWWCKKLPSFTVPKNVSAIGAGAFVNVKSVKVAPGNKFFKIHKSGELLRIDGSVMYYMPPDASGDYIIPDGVKYVAAYTFWWCDKLSSITFPKGCGGADSYDGRYKVIFK